MNAKRVLMVSFVPSNKGIGGVHLFLQLACAFAIWCVESLYKYPCLFAFHPLAQILSIHTHISYKGQPNTCQCSSE